MEELRLYTIADLKAWIFEGKPKEGLSESVITPTRAFAYVNNPYANDGLPVVSALFSDGELAAFTTAFPERLLRPDCTTHWFNSLYVSPKHEGKGYGAFVIGSLMECYGDDPVFDMDAVPASVEILSYFGLRTGDFKLYEFRNKSFDGRSLKGRIAKAYNRCQVYLESHGTVKKLMERANQSEYIIKYDNFIDEDTFLFIKGHSEGDAFLRNKEMFNWMLRYPFVHEAPLLGRMGERDLFSSAKEWQRYHVVKVYVKNAMAGVYILCDSSTRLLLSYLYYDPRFEEELMLSIAEHILKIGNARFATTSAVVADFVRRNKLYSLSLINHPSLCCTEAFADVFESNIQSGDGDMFLN